MFSVRLIVLIGVILAAAVSRVIPHPPNFTPIAAMALFGGAQFADRRLAFLVPLSAMFASDLVIGLHRLLPVIYACFALIVCLGFWVRQRRSIFRITGATLAGSVLFFVVTNFAVWAAGSLYPKTLEGLVAAYVAAIPFFRNTVLGDALYVVVLFGGFALIESMVAVLRDDSPAARRQTA
ncbi:MAG TPA: DUF6580 family putative transport protein [Jiangellaceae bacterium]|nr:DUF6580 family putative transport protein [Jiangellaceae bacterium]